MDVHLFFARTAPDRYPVLLLFCRLRRLVRVPIAGRLRTAASWIREFVRGHPAYKFDSVVSQEVNYDLMLAIDEMSVSPFTASNPGG